MTSLSDGGYMSDQAEEGWQEMEPDPCQEMAEVPYDLALKTKALTWTQLADLYDKEHSGRPARTTQLNTVFEWAKRHPKIIQCPVETTLHWREDYER
jgi:hypothetical protein